MDLGGPQGASPPGSDVGRHSTWVAQPVVPAGTSGVARAMGSEASKSNRMDLPISREGGYTFIHYRNFLLPDFSVSQILFVEEQHSIL